MDRQIVPDQLRYGVGIFAFYSLWVGCVSLIPMKFGKSLFSDGRNIWRIVTGTFPVDGSEKYASKLSVYTDQEILPTIYPNSSSYVAHLTAPGDMSSLSRRRFVHRAIIIELSSDHLLPEEEMLLLDRLMSDGLRYGDDHLRPSLDSWSLRALQLGPNLDTLKGSRGAILVEIGRYAEGKVILDLVLERLQVLPTPPVFDIYMTLLYLSKAERNLGNIDRATQLFAEGKAVGYSTDVEGQFLKRLQSETIDVPSLETRRH
jgi:hypothetical protein